MSREIKILHLEPTDVCQAACPQCVRETDTNFDKNQNHHLAIDQISQKLSPDVIAGLEKMFMCGNYGDPAAGRHTLEIYQWFREINPGIVLGMNTNGGIRVRSWWQELAKIMHQERDYVVFSIDGLADTNHIYRRNVDWAHMIQNIEAFITAGGRAHWDMLVYEHNQHQVEQCRQLARSMGFTWFRTKLTRRPMTAGLRHPADYIPVVQSQGRIDCIALREQSLFIDAQGRVSPCCWLGSRQTDFITDIEQVQSTWETDQCDPTCRKTCTVSNNKTTFHNQWASEEALC